MEKSPYDVSQFMSGPIQSESQRFLPGNGRFWSQTHGRDRS